MAIRPIPRSIETSRSVFHLMRELHSVQGTVAGHVQREKRRLVAMSAENPDRCTAVVTSAECQKYPSFATHAFGVRKFGKDVLSVEF